MTYGIRAYGTDTYGVDQTTFLSGDAVANSAAVSDSAFILGYVDIAGSAYAMASASLDTNALPECAFTECVSHYLDYVTSEHADKTKFLHTICVITTPLCEALNQLRQMPGLYDVDSAIGEQLDVVGQWVGLTRKIKTPLPPSATQFSFDITSLGFDQGFWDGPFTSLFGITLLDDPHYRLLIKAKIITNHWYGSIEEAYAAYNELFLGLDSHILIKDFGNLTMGLGITGIPDAITLALLNGGYLNIRPAGVLMIPYIPCDGPPFGFDEDDSLIGGFDHGCWI